MDKCCTSEQAPRTKRRLHGLQPPLHFQQVLGWIVFFITAAINFFIITRIQLEQLELWSYVIYGLMYVSHAITHLAAMLLDPSEMALRKLAVDNVPEFDRSVHAHVIENGRCHLCNVQTSKKTKHCSLCNKCVECFDHHCKWLNNCVGKRNYPAFIGCVITAMSISSFTASLCLLDIVYFFLYPDMLSMSTQDYVSCSVADTKFCKNSIIFLIFLILYTVSSFSITCALLHLYCFHVYISLLGVSTYEYIVNSNEPNRETSIFSKFHVKRYRDKKKIGAYKQDDESYQTPVSDRSQESRNPDITRLITTIINNEVDKAKKIFFIDKNKIHPSTDVN